LIPSFHYPEYFAKYCDERLKRSSGKKVLPELLQQVTDRISDEDKLKELVILLRYVEDRDIFQKFYSRLLAKRLIHNTYLALDAELDVILQLRQLCGYEYTQKFHKMIVDVELSRELDTQFNHAKIGFDLKTLVLSSASWPLPLESIVEFTIPIEVPRFCSFYLLSISTYID
jgi:hypothetical protein